MTSICVYLGANAGNNPAFSEAVLCLGEQIARMGARLVYGGSSQGLMGLLATTVLSHGGKVTGVITEHLIPQERPLSTLDELIVVETMQERKLVMQQKAQVFIVVPGGLGTLEEAFETWNAIKIGTLDKPIGFLNSDGFFNSLFSFISIAENAGFISSKQAKIPKINENPALLLAELLGTKASIAAKI
jgi:uncharacterized protein (TIGR00730 family)